MDAFKRLSYHRPHVSIGAATDFLVRYKRTIENHRAPSGPHFCCPADTISDTLSPRLWYMSYYCYISHEQGLILNLPAFAM